MVHITDTYFAPAVRADINIINQQSHLFQNDSLVSNLTNSISEILLVLNKERQIVYANQRLFELLGSSDWSQILGQRPGELFNCIHSDELAGGCGTTESCRGCGGIKSILESQKGKQSINEWRILNKAGKAFDLKVCSTPYQKDEYQYTIFALTDISDEKWRQMLERTFFHDVLNTATVTLGFSEILSENIKKKENLEITKMIGKSSTRLVEEIQSQRILLSAERGEFKTSLTKINSLALTKEITELYSNLKFAEGKIIITDDSSVNIDFYSDKVLIGRILGNMLKNALEASNTGETITIFCSRQQNDLMFSVHNVAYIPRNVQLQIFKRSFSTKGSGRGIGTYSIKLFTEQYLSGKIWFTTTKSNGTTFYFSLPLQSENPE